MEQLLAYTCYELNCYLDELKGNRRGDVSIKRRIAILVLSLAGVDNKKIGIILNKHHSSLIEAKKIASKDEKILAEKILLNFYNWKNRRFH